MVGRGLLSRRKSSRHVYNNESSPAAHVPKKRLNQTCLHFENFIPECAWCELRSRNISVLPRAQLIARVGASIGLINPSEPTLFRMVAVLAYGGGDYDMTQQQVWDYMEKIQTFTKSVKTPRDMMYIVDYPVSASLLPDSLASSAYPSGDLPVDVTIPDLDTIISDKKQRGRGRDMAWLQFVPEVYRHIVAAQVLKKEPSTASSPFTRELPLANAFTRELPLANAFAREPPTANNMRGTRQWIKSETPIKVQVTGGVGDETRPLSAKDESADESEEQPAAIEAAPLDGTVEAMELNMVTCAATRKLAKADAKKDAADKSDGAAGGGAEKGKGKEAGTSVVLKRPACKTMESPACKIMKRPSAGNPAILKRLTKDIDMTDVFDKLREKRKRKECGKHNTFCSFTYDNGRRRAERGSACADDAKCFARGCVQTAACIWNE